MNHSRTIAFGILGLLAFSLAAVSCEPHTPGTDCTDCTTDDRITATYDPKPYAFNLPSWFPAPIILPDNPLTVDGVELGRPAPVAIVRKSHLPMTAPSTPAFWGFRASATPWP